MFWQLTHNDTRLWRNLGRFLVAILAGLAAFSFLTMNDSKAEEPTTAEYRAVMDGKPVLIEIDHLQSKEEMERHESAEWRDWLGRTPAGKVSFDGQDHPITMAIRSSQRGNETIQLILGGEDQNLRLLSFTIPLDGRSGTGVLTKFEELDVAANGSLYVEQTAGKEIELVSVSRVWWAD